MHSLEEAQHRTQKPLVNVEEAIYSLPCRSDLHAIRLQFHASSRVYITFADLSTAGMPPPPDFGLHQEGVGGKRSHDGRVWTPSFESMGNGIWSPKSVVKGLGEDRSGRSGRRSFKFL